MIPITEVPEKHPKLVLMFERETGKNATFKKNGKITGQFIYWLHQKINEKNKQSKTIIMNNPCNPLLLKFFLNSLIM